MHFMQYNGGLGPAVFVMFQLHKFSGHGIGSTLMILVDGGLECKVCILCFTRHGSLRMAV